MTFIKPNIGYISEAIVALGHKVSIVPETVVDEATYKAGVHWITSVDESTNVATTTILDNPPVSWSDVSTKVTALKAKDVIINKIIAFEDEITPRRLRDSVLTSDGKTWLTNKEAEIATERDKL